MQNTGGGLPKFSATPADLNARERDFVRAVPQLRRFANRLLPDSLEVEAVITEVRDMWINTKGSFDAPIRHLLRIVAQLCIERQRAITRAMPELTNEENAFLNISGIARVSLLIAVNRLPRRAREAYVASVLSQSIVAEQEVAKPLACNEQVHAVHPCLSAPKAPSYVSARDPDPVTLGNDARSE